MEKITSFTIDHLKLQPGLYVSRKDKVGEETVTTFDLRLTSPNEEPVMNTAEVHTIEHLAATFLRNHPVYKDKTIYFGPMGCQTGFYLLVRSAQSPKEVFDMTKKVLKQIIDHEGEVFGASAIECGHYENLSLEAARMEAKLDLEVLEAQTKILVASASPSPRSERACLSASAIFTTTSLSA